MSLKRSLLALGLPKEVLTALTRDGYSSLEDLANVTPERLEKDLKIPINIARDLVNRSQNPSTFSPTLTMTQPVAKLVENAPKQSTKCLALDKILEGGLSRGHVLEISGPPGSPKEIIGINILASFIEDENEAIFVDCQNMVSPSILRQRLEGKSLRLIHYTRLHALADFLLFIHQLPTFLQSHPKVSLLVVNSVSTPFQSATMSLSQRKTHLETIKQIFSRVCALHGLTIVTISQMATKMLNPDGSAGNFDSGAKGIILPQLGLRYLPNGKSFQVAMLPDGLHSGCALRNPNGLN
ncbi:hypothetical protein CPB84DRAFT_1676807 [Gymnopilus junonius]|uniref:RecA family profile 1 domain-containing protein n=1 Tax=Gymnopilus junonius TaxID=109634 RepID=A0A9P5NTY0_GYMJU|nr:hypothetical protein CPB84DRAFT_1676807 [Gymnopilus junonius]